ncbi:MAG TPA: hypothetical protein VKS22_16150 [Candidatus Binataceae bacterium]|nr:hypothetical protein [Candidatus Binataceae bacterium]
MDFNQLHNRRGISLAAALLLITAVIPLALRAQTDDPDSTPALTEGISEAATPDWSRVDDSSPDSSGQVLELPQVIDPGESSADATPADAASADGATDDSVAAMDSNDAAAATLSGNEAAYLDDYANRLAAARALALAPRSIPYYPGVSSWRYITIPPSSVIIVRPGGLSAIPANSPLLMSPRGSGPVFGGWWHRVR